MATNIPYDPRWSFAQLLEILSREHRPGSVTSGKTRNVLLLAWARHVGRIRAVRELNEAIRTHGTASAAARAFQMSTTTLGKLREDFAAMPDPSEDSGLVNILLASDLAQLRTLPRETLHKIITAVVAALGQKGIGARIASANLTDEFVESFRVAIRVAELKKAVDELRRHLDAGTTSENVFQDWCERHSWAFGNAYVARDPLRNISPGDQLDLLLPTILGFRDIVELKRPDMAVLRYDKSHRNYYFSAESSAAIGQCHRYLDVLHEEAAKGLRDHPHIVAYHPLARVVIGRSREWDPEKTRALHGLNRRMHGITLMTYDHLLEQCEQLLKTLTETS